MGNIQDLLSSIKAEQEHSDPTSSHSTSSHSTSQEDATVSSPTPSSLNPAQAIDDLLSQFGEASPSASPRSFSLDSVLTRPISQTRGLDQPRSVGTLDLSSLPLSPPKAVNAQAPAVQASAIQSTLPILNDLKAQFLEEQRQREAQERAEQERLAQEREAALAKARQRQEEEAKAKQARLAKAAEEWLRQLQPLSGEAIWFDEFASHYNSRLEAAIDYLNLDS